MSDTYYYPAVIQVDGVVTDSADPGGKKAGTVKSLRYEEQYDKRIQGDVDVAADGTFSFSIDTLGPPMLQGTLYIVVTATDWNGNASEITIPALDKTTGPDIAMLGSTSGLYHYSSILPGKLYFDGIVNLSASWLRYNMENPEGTIRITDRYLYIDPSKGNFTIEFDPDSPAVSGMVKFVLQAFDGLMSSTVFYVRDDPDPPQFDAAASTVSFDNTYVDLFFTEPIYHSGGGDPVITDFTSTPIPVPPAGTATVGGFIGAPAAGDSTVRLSLSVTGVPVGTETIQITAGNITDKVGNPLPPPSSTITLSLSDKTPPEVVDIRTDPGYEGKSYNSTASIPIIVEFSEPVTVTEPVSLILSTGASAGLTAGDKTDELEFTYFVASGENTVPPDHLDATGLTGTLTDDGLNTVSNPAVPAGKLAAMNITIDTDPPPQPGLDVDDADMQISKEENQSGIPFGIQGEVGADYAIVLTRCFKSAGPALTGTIMSSDWITGFLLKTSSPSGEDAVIEVTVTDAAGNVSPTASESLLIATISPDPPVFDTVAHHTNTTPLQWQWHSGGGGDGNYRFRVNDPDLSAVPAQPVTTYGYTPAPEVDGEHTLYVQEKNGIGNWSDSAWLTLTLDRAAPVVTAPADITVLATSGSGTPDSHPEIADFLDGATAFDAIDGSLSAEPVPATPSTFPIGVTTVTFAATDSAGNTGTDSATVTVVEEDIAVTAPNGGEEWGAGSNHTITWSSSGAGNVKIDLLKGGTFDSTIDSSTPNDGSYSWAIPSGQATAGDYRIEITTLSTPAYSDQSDADFTISP